ncbi:hypothetical protein OIU78_024529 [Salix suchowensis]|nr:hypothetical protein OIU78_024529 [Salix suchowensis]
MLGKLAMSEEGVLHGEKTSSSNYFPGVDSSAAFGHGEEEVEVEVVAAVGVVIILVGDMVEELVVGLEVHCLDSNIYHLLCCLLTGLVCNLWF